jgi:hypothetical protein
MASFTVSGKDPLPPRKRKRVKKGGTTSLEGESICLQQPTKGHGKRSNDEEEALNLSWREDPGLLWLSENSKYWDAIKVFSCSKIPQAGNIGLNTSQTSMRCHQIGPER